MARTRRPRQAGEVTKGQAKPKGTPKVEPQSEPAFDSRTESRWSIPMLVAWIAWRDFDLVSEQNPGLRSEHWHRHILLDPTFSVRLSLEIRGERTVARLGQMDEAFRAQGNLPSTAIMTIPEAVANLRRKWADGLVTATGLNKEGEAVEIPSRELPYLESREEAGRDVLRYRHQWGIDDLESSKPAYTEVRFPRRDALRVWPEPPVTAKTATACRKWLIDQMQASPNTPPKSKSKLFQDATKKFAISRRSFDAEWKNAIKETEAKAWSAVGRRSK
jgi:hypothetical protein